MGFKEVKSQFLSIFRQAFVYHHRSLEFRCKLFAAMIVANPEAKNCEFTVLKEIAQEIYKDDEYRVEVMVRTTKEYVQKVIHNNDLDIDVLIMEINKELKANKRFVQKINLEHLRRFMCQQNEEANLLQTRILEFLEAEIRDRTS
jgi:hypothetical protein